GYPSLAIRPTGEVARSRADIDVVAVERTCRCNLVRPDRGASLRVQSSYRAVLLADVHLSAAESLDPVRVATTTPRPIGISWSLILPQDLSGRRVESEDSQVRRQKHGAARERQVLACPAHDDGLPLHIAAEICLV